MTEPEKRAYEKGYAEALATFQEVLPSPSQRPLKTMQIWRTSKRNS